jgi:hypothetical protein
LPFNNTQGFVTQYQGGTWSTALPHAGAAAGNIPGSWVQTNSTYSIPTAANADGAYFSKASDQVTPLPVTWLSFTVRQTAGCSVELAWSTAQEENSSTLYWRVQL